MDGHETVTCARENQVSQRNIEGIQVSKVISNFRLYILCVSEMVSLILLIYECKWPCLYETRCAVDGMCAVAAN